MNGQPQNAYAAFSMMFQKFKGSLEMVVGGLATFFLTVWFFFYVRAFESGEMAEASAWWPVAMLYNVVGKWPVVGLGIVIGLGLIIGGALSLLFVYRRETAT